jgi:hypothetical protein
MALASLRIRLIRAASLVLWFVVLVAGAEVLAQSWVRWGARRGKLFTVDLVLGWRPKGGLDLARRNANGDLWQVVTAPAGWRYGPTHPRSPRHHVLVLGDSYAFGEGVNVEDRFDEVIARSLADSAGVEFVNRGVMGFGTDQQVLAGAPYLDSLSRGDVVLLVTYQNDMIDIQRQRFAGRAKPWFEPSGDSLVLHLPSITWKERLRDASYLAAVAFASRERPMESYTESEWRRGIQLYEAIVRRTAAALERRGVLTLVAHHGDSLLVHASGVADPYASLATVRNVRALSLDSALSECRGSTTFLRDGHWGAAGHACVARQLEGVLKQLARTADGAQRTAVDMRRP